MLPALTWREAATWRAGRQYLDRRARAGSLLSVAGRLCGLHAQLLSSAELTAWARVEGLERGAVQRALWEERTLVKTWAMRGTLHLLPAAELPLWHGALALSPRYLRPALWQKNFGMSMEDLDQLTKRVAAALEGRILTREELVGHMGSFGSQVGASSWGTVLKPAAFSGHLCFAPSIGQRVRFTRPDTWLGTTAGRLDAAEATCEVARHYLSAYGPATFHDLARWWGGGGVAAARQWIAALGDQATAVDLEGTQAWMLKAHLRQARGAVLERSVRLLPAFDQYVIGASWHAARLMPEALRARVYRPQGWVSPVILVNGRMEGTWRHTVKGSRVEVAFEPFDRFPAWVRKGAEAEAERLAAFLGLQLSIQPISPPAARPPD